MWSLLKRPNTVSLNDALKAMEPSPAEISGRLVPSDFDATAPDIYAVMLPDTYTWSSCAETLRYFSSRGVMMRLPLFWQVEALLYGASHDADTYISINDRANMPVGALAIREGIVDTVVTDLEDATRFASYLIDNGRQLPRCWIIVRSMSNAAHHMPLRLSGAKIAQEVHLVPGVPLLSQCETLLGASETQYHLAPYLERADARRGSIITSRENAPLRLSNVHIPVRMIERGVCACGQHIYSVEQ